MIRVASLLGLLIEDDRNFLGQMLQLLPRTISNFDIHWDSSDEFDNAIERIMRYRYDIIVTDVYANAVHKGKTPGDNKANDIVAAIRKTRMCPIFVYSSGSCPDSIEKEQGPFLIYADKAHPKFAKTLSDELHNLIKTGIPGIARRLHDELDAVSGPSFLWSFLQDHWNKLQKAGFTSPDTLERLIRKRASVQLGRLDPQQTGAKEIDFVSASEYYLMPPVADGLRLGTILRESQTNNFFVVLTPHCHLTIQPGKSCPRADHVLLIPAIPFDVVARENPDLDPREGKGSKRNEKLRKAIQSPAQIGKAPQGRYWFLPGFLDIPSSYCDFTQTRSVPYETAGSDYESLATLDTPFAEALQSCFISFYGSVGLPSLRPDDFEYLIDPNQSNQPPR